MLATKCYEYLEFDTLQIHPVIGNHRKLDWDKVNHYEKDILTNGLLEPLVVWEKSAGEFYLIGGFHRAEAIKEIRKKYQDYFNRVDVRIVTGAPDEMRALNLKLNADRVDTKLTDFFDTIVHLNNANWEVERISEFLDKRVAWVGDILHYAPIMDRRVRELLEDGRISWAKAKQICNAVEKAPAGEEEEVLNRALESVQQATSKTVKVERPLTFRTAKKRIQTKLAGKTGKTYSLSGEDVMALLLVLEGKHYDESHLARLKDKLPDLLEG